MPKAIKFPRVMVSNERLESLRKEAKRTGKKIAHVAEEKFVKAK